ncbi:hypothetical protein B0T19DRAFT_201400 [Cercophora scortea]|uniref:Rhodopsin domain-containing protein n=1 Tax=Cercophora scortea TaxID=314031 RepID=A0AAE0M8Z2_9PEZI|nr:hypothetical protein B0T19DRAFT_201400 [Cercophora scortea]
MAAIVNGVPVAMPPPPGYVVDFDHPERNSVTEAYWLFGAGNFICLLFVLQRAYVRVVLQRRVQLEDVCLGIAYAFSLTVQIIIIRDFMIGIMGIHLWELPFNKFLMFMETLYQLPILYNPVQCFAKLTLLLLYRRLSPQRWFQMIIWVVMFIVVGSSTSIMFATIFPCHPVAAGWDPTIPEYTCIDRVAVYKATAILGAITDALVLAVPLPIVAIVQVSTRQKLGLVAIFSVGGITVFTSIMRLIELIRSMGYVDQTWGGGPVVLWILVESNLSIICGTLPTIKHFLRHVSPGLLGSTGRDSKYANGKGSKPNTHDTPLATIGGTGAQSKNRYDKYQRFDDPERGMFPLETVTRAEGGRDSVSNDGDPNDTRDSGSEKAIIQTRTATVTYTTRD